MSTSCQASMACGVYLLSRVFLSPLAPLLSSEGQPLPPGMSSHRGPCSMLSCFSQVQLFATLWTVACQAPLSIGFLQQEYWSVSSQPRDGNHISCLPAVSGWFFNTVTTWEAPWGPRLFSSSYLRYRDNFISVTQLSDRI